MEHHCEAGVGLPTSARVDILCRYVKFFRSLRKSAYHEVQVLFRLVARDNQTVTGKNLMYISEESGLNPWTASHGMKAALIAGEASEVPQ